jgi:hypothetical protein
MKRTTGAEPTALSIAARVSVDRNRRANGLYWGEVNFVKANESEGLGRVACRNAYGFRVS